ncbi:TetR/AcrR family transcriptional regulator [Fulvivirgaceae bacterium PWU4]|uniref:TetR/AcrR family transcriptional regulator n=1 Tax=Chryseosolibacter histidini TaxID=2782349 RepID=A0AAP2GRF8_9BACT|nr:TetR/AcrR family transcriptional regulator [Chryseosolibacter histidini]MBT1701123.1 TetR/AcrR family transcriptional regulator [Chryseosolibacter histidini]
MGVAERKERHKEELKKEILMAAKELFMEKGYEATSIRNIAEKIEYSPATVYLYYKDKDEIMHALHQEGFKMLVAYFGTLNTIPEPFGRLIAMGRAYIQFAMENPEMYELIFVMKDPIDHVASCADDSWDEGDRAYDVLFQTVVECQKSGDFQGFEPHGLSFTIWSTMHGLCSLRISGHLGHVAEASKVKPDVDSLMTYTFETFTGVLEKIR